LDEDLPKVEEAKEPPRKKYMRLSKHFQGVSQPKTTKKTGGVKKGGGTAQIREK